MCTEHVVEGLTPGVLYTFYVTATNFDGEGSSSVQIQLKSCVKPSEVSAPTLLSSSSTSATLRWEQPGSDGGCPVASFAILTDMGHTFGDFSTSLEAVHVANKPYLFEHTVPFSAAETGEYLRFKLQATNERGSTTSYEYLSVLLASVPE